MRDYNAIRATDPSTRTSLADREPLTTLIEGVAGAFVNRLVRCPFCEKELSETPARPIERCPGCGMDLDRRWTIFGGPRHVPRVPTHGAFRFIVTAVCVAAVTTLGIAYALLHPAVLTWAPPLLVAGITFVVFIVHYQPVARATVGPGGITLFQRKIRKAHLPWTRIFGARIAHAGFDIRIELTGNTLLEFARFQYFGWRFSEGRQFVAAVCAGAAEHRWARQGEATASSSSHQKAPGASVPHDE